MTIFPNRILLILSEKVIYIYLYTCNSATRKYNLLITYNIDTFVYRLNGVSLLVHAINRYVGHMWSVVSCLKVVSGLKWSVYLENNVPVVGMYHHRTEFNSSLANSSVSIRHPTYLQSRTYISDYSM